MKRSACIIAALVAAAIFVMLPILTVVICESFPLTPIPATDNETTDTPPELPPGEHSIKR